MPPQPHPHTLHIGASRLEIWPDCVVTILPGPEPSSKLLAAPQDNDAYRETAARHGYATSPAGLMRLCAEHEATHSWLASILGLNESPTLRAVADNSPNPPIELMQLEEAAVMAIQAFAMAAQVNILDAIEKLSQTHLNRAPPYA